MVDGIYHLPYTISLVELLIQWRVDSESYVACRHVCPPGTIMCHCTTVISSHIRVRPSVIQTHKVHTSIAGKTTGPSHQSINKNHYFDGGCSADAKIPFFVELIHQKSRCILVSLLQCSISSSYCLLGLVMVSFVFQL